MLLNPEERPIFMNNPSIDPTSLLGMLRMQIAEQQEREQSSNGSDLNILEALKMLTEIIATAHTEGEGFLPLSEQEADAAIAMALRAIYKEDPAYVMLPYCRDEDEE
jgi:hypothetical protein